MAARPSAWMLSCLALLAAACARPAPPGDTIVLLAARTLGPDAQVAALLDDMAAVTDVLGPARFEVLRARDPAAFADALRRHDNLRAVIALVGDLSLMDGIDPNRWPQPEPRLTSRAIDVPALWRDLARLEAVVRARGGVLVLATAPLGRQGRIEVPELVDLHRKLLTAPDGSGGPPGERLDLAAHFAALEPAPLFANGIDVLDGYGEEELARALWTACLADDGPLPARDAAERAARAEARALQAIHRGELESWPGLIAEALAGAPASPRHASRRAALRSLRDGLGAAAEDWAAIEPGHDELPGFAIGRCLAAGSAAAAVLEAGRVGAPSGDPVARQLLDVLDALADLEAAPEAREEAAARALSRAQRLVDARPDRLEAWLALQVVSAFLLPGRDLRAEARDALANVPRSAVSPRTVEAIFDRWPQGVDALPALLAASRPFARLRPSGPLLESARRRAALGLHATAAAQLKRGLSRGRYPRSWRAELAQLREP